MFGYQELIVPTSYQFISKDANINTYFNIYGSFWYYREENCYLFIPLIITYSMEDILAEQRGLVGMVLEQGQFGMVQVEGQEQEGDQLLFPKVLGL